MSIREKTLRRLANLSERDEREEYITGKASRAAYTSTLSLLIFFIFLSAFSFSISKDYDTRLAKGYQYTASISVDFSLLNKAQVKHAPAEQVLFDSKNYMLSNTSILFILLGWQLLSFSLAAKKERSE